VLPACCPSVITVSAIYTNALPQPGGSNTVDAPAQFSNFATADADVSRMVAAPGVNILSTLPTPNATVTLNGATNYGR
jgi:hypothetical protein